MILHSLRAVNFKKFREIDLQHLPTRGLVGVVGPNEGGKSSIVDAITFALFGRTPVSDIAGIESLIHWEEEVCQVEMVFGLPDESRWRLFREVDRMGDHLTQLERIDGREQSDDMPQDLSEAMASLTIDEVASGRVISGALRVARELRKLLGYSYDDFRQSFYLAQHAVDNLGRLTLSREGGTDGPTGILAGGAREASTAPSSPGAATIPDWSGVLFRITGLDKLDRAIRKASGVTSSIHTELRQVEEELEVQGRVLAALGVEAGDEPTLRREIDSLEREIASAETTRRSAKARIETRRTQLAQRATAGRELGGLALAMLRERVATKVRGLARGLAKRHDTLSEERGQVERELAAARDRRNGVDRLRSTLGELETRLVERRRHVEARLGSGDPESLIDERDDLNAQIGRLRGGGRAATVFGIILLVLAATGGVVLAVGGVPLPTQITPTILRGIAIGLALLGLFLLLDGMRRRSNAQRELGGAQARLEEMDHQVAQLMGEREILNREPLAVARDTRATHIGDDRLREIVTSLARDHRDFLDRTVGIDDYAGELGRAVEDNERRLRHLDATVDRLTHLRSSAEEAAEELLPFVRTEPAAEVVEEIDLGALEEGLVELKQRAADLTHRLEDDVRPIRERLPALHEVIDGFGDVAREKLAEVESRLQSGEAVDEGDRHLVGKIDGILAELPGEKSLREEMEQANGERETAERLLAGATTRLEDRRAELERLKPQFDKRRTAQEQTQVLMSKAQDLRAEHDRERTATRLLQGTADQLRSRLAPTLGRTLGRRLGRITGGRYSRVSVDLDFGIHIFSDERNAFMDPVELSGGTHDQLLLSLRLAFAEVLLATRAAGSGPHVLLLDEPLESFDATRAEHLLALLKEGDTSLAQVILLANQENVAEICDLAIRTTVDEQTLRASGTPMPRSATPLTHREH